MDFGDDAADAGFDVSPILGCEGAEEKDFLSFLRPDFRKIEAVLGHFREKESAALCGGVQNVSLQFV